MKKNKVRKKFGKKSCEKIGRARFAGSTATGLVCRGAGGGINPAAGQEAREKTRIAFELLLLCGYETN